MKKKKLNHNHQSPVQLLIDKATITWLNTKLRINVDLFMNMMRHQIQTCDQRYSQGAEFK